MVKVNGNDVEWKKAPNFVKDVQRQLLWKDDQTGATFAILKVPKGFSIEQPPHSHPNANQFTFRLSGEIEFPDGTHISYPEDTYGFSYCPKNEKHGGTPKGTKILKDLIYIHYWDGPDDWDTDDD